MRNYSGVSCFLPSQSEPKLACGKVRIAACIRSKKLRGSSETAENGRWMFKSCNATYLQGQTDSALSHLFDRLGISNVLLSVGCAFILAPHIV